MATVTTYPFRNSTKADLLYSILLALGGTMADVKQLYNNSENDLLYAVLEAIVNGGGTGGGTVTEDVLANIQAGAIANGDTVAAGTTLTNFVKQLVQNVYVPVLNDPAFSISNNQAALLKIGAAVDVLLTFTFNRGSIILQGNFQAFRAGAATGYTFIRANDTNYPGMPQVGDTYTVNAYAVVQGINAFKGTVDYAIGAQPKDSSNNNYGAPLAAGTSPVQATGFEGVYPLFATTANIATATEQGLLSMINANNIVLDLVAEAGGNKQKFWLPKAWTDARALTAVQYYNPVSGSFDPTNKIADFTTAADTQNVSGNVINYTKFTNASADRGATQIRLIF